MIPEDIIERIGDYFRKGYSHRLIHYLLEKNHDYRIGFHYLKRIIPSLGFRRRGFMVHDIDDLLKKAHDEIHNGCSGCENLRRTLNVKYKIQVTRKFAREIVRELDPIGIERRKKRRLRRRQYINRGPNYVWHIDGYDKLAPYGIYIHGCIDGFSRRIIWVEAGLTNKRPEVVANYYLNAVERLNGYPVKLRADPGTENGMVATMHALLWDDHQSVTYGPSTSNQRIERWWGILRQCKADYWIDHFKMLEGDGHFNKGNRIHIMCIQYVYLPIIKRQLVEVIELWNSHRIRQQRLGDVVSGIPDILYTNPEISDAANYISAVPQGDIIEELKALCNNNFNELNTDFLIVVQDIIVANQLPYPVDDFDDARHMYIILSEYVTNLM